MSGPDIVKHMVAWMLIGCGLALLPWVLPWLWRMIGQRLFSEVTQEDREEFRRWEQSEKIRLAQSSRDDEVREWKARGKK